jgi:hypothetical protein
MITECNITMTRVKKLIRYCKKYAKFGSYIEVNEVTSKQDKFESYDVTMYVPVVRIDKNGKMRLKETDAN